ncbi:MAG: ribonuclease BN (tRNA processing enzyme) [Rhodothermales bacterium]
MNRLPIQGSLSLENDGALEIVFLGVGSAFSLRNHQTNFLIVKGDTHVLVDCGTMAPIAMRELGFLPSAITAVLPTHSHADHVGGLEYLALVSRYIAIPKEQRPKPGMIITEAYQKLLWEQTLRGGLGWNEPQGLSLTDYFDILRPEPVLDAPREAHRITIGDIRIELFRSCHIPQSCASWRDAQLSYGLLIDDRVFVCSDTRFDPGLIASYAPRAEILFHDVDFQDGAVHSSLRELRSLPEDVRHRMMLVHYPDDWPEHDFSGFAGLTQPKTRYRFE